MAQTVPVRSASPDREPAAVANTWRTPQQGRSKASLGRMVSAARALMIERGSEDFTLGEVSKRGQVSIGSIYLRFESKDNLVRAVLAEGLANLMEAEAAMLKALSADCASLREFVPAYVEAYAGVLADHAPLLRLTMLRADHDPEVAAPGKRAAAQAEEESITALLRHAAEFGGTDHQLRAMATVHIVFATLARKLSLGSTRQPLTTCDWGELKRELARMCLAYLTAP